MKDCAVFADRSNQHHPSFVLRDTSRVPQLRRGVLQPVAGFIQTNGPLVCAVVLGWLLLFQNSKQMMIEEHDACDPRRHRILAAVNNLATTLRNKPAP